MLVESYLHLQLSGTDATTGSIFLVDELDCEHRVVFLRWASLLDTRDKSASCSLDILKLEYITNSPSISTLPDCPRDNPERQVTRKRRELRVLNSHDENQLVSVKHPRRGELDRTIRSFDSFNRTGC